MTPQELKALPVKEIAKETSVMFMWTTGPKMDEAIDLAQSWGFKHCTVYKVWVKTQANGEPVFGLGSYSRSCCEFLLLSTRGRGYTGLFTDARKFERQLIDDNKITDVILSARRKHSQKPDEMYDILEANLRPDLHKIELFSRTERAGWDHWGDQVIDDETGDLMQLPGTPFRKKPKK